jgi:DNA-binding transcriptional ArsR family regulator
MQDQSKQSNRDEAALRQAVRHPKRLQILGHLTEKRAGVDESGLADALGSSRPLVRYHLEILQSAGLVAHAKGPQPDAAERFVVSA